RIVAWGSNDGRREHRRGSLEDAHAPTKTNDRAAAVRDGTADSENFARNLADAATPAQSRPAMARRARDEHEHRTGCQGLARVGQDDPAPRARRPVSRGGAPR